MDGMTPTETETEQPRKLTLNEIVDLYMQELFAGEGEVTLRLETLDGLLDDKALGYKHVARALDAKIAGQQAELKHLEDEMEPIKARIEAIKKEKDRLAERLATAMRETGKTKIQTVLGRIYFQKHPVVKLPEGWAVKAAADYPQYVQEKPAVFEPKKTVLLCDFKAQVKTFMGSGMSEADAWAAAKDLMPEGFDVDPNEKLKGL